MSDGLGFLANIVSGFVFLDCLKMNELENHMPHESRVPIVFSTAWRTTLLIFEVPLCGKGKF